MKREKIRGLGLLMSAVVLCTSLTACGQSGQKRKKIEGVGDLGGATIGVMDGSVAQLYVSEISFTFPCQDLNTLFSDETWNSFLDAAIIDRIVAEDYLSVSLRSDLTILEPPVETVPYVITYKKGNNELGEQLNNALKSLKEDGTIDEIVSHWVGENADCISYVPKTQNPQGELKMVTCSYLPPFTEESQNGLVGIEPDVMRAVCDKLGMSLVIEDKTLDYDVANDEFGFYYGKFDEDNLDNYEKFYQQYGLQGVLNAVDSGEADVAVCRMSVQKEYLDKFSFTDSYFDSEQVIVTYK